MTTERKRAELDLTGSDRKRADLDLSSFAPKPAPTPPALSHAASLAIPPAVPSTELAAAIARESGFQSRTVAPAKRAPTKYARIAIDVPDALRSALQDGARKSGLGTVRAVILDALKGKGYAVDSEEITDRRKQ